jgi:GNAT superfamily N-acetyltransferase
VTATFHIRPARPTDGPAIVRLVNGLASFEKLPGPDAEAAHRLIAAAFCETPPFAVLVAEVEGTVQGYALFFYGYSTFRAAPTLWLEDLFVDPEVRGRGIGRGLMRELARTAVAHGCARFEWSVLDWNENAQRFYQSVGATVLGEWLVCRVEGNALVRLGES